MLPWEEGSSQGFIDYLRPVAPGERWRKQRAEASQASILMTAKCHYSFASDATYDYYNHHPLLHLSTTYIVCVECLRVDTDTLCTTEEYRSESLITASHLSARTLPNTYIQQS